MWYDDLQPGYPWSSLWYDYIICDCGGIRQVDGMCPICAAVITHRPPEAVRLEDGGEITVSLNMQMGAEGRMEDYIYLDLLEREWRRPLIPQGSERESLLGVSERAAIVVLYWSYFETRIERLLRAGMRDLPSRVVEEMLGRYSAIGARLDRLYRVLFDTSFRADLEALGYEHVGQHLDEVQRRRNAFAHGDPASIDDTIVAAVVDNLKLEHEAWIAVFNRRMIRVAT